MGTPEGVQGEGRERQISRMSVGMAHWFAVGVRGHASW